MAGRKIKILTQKGFTMSELIVSLFIIGLISTLVLSSYSSGRRVAELKISTQKLAADLRYMQNNTLGLVKNDEDGSIPPGGWGLHIDTALSAKNYSYFTDDDAGHDFDSDEENKVIPMSGDIVIDSIKVDAADTTWTDIIFFPPDPATYINGASTSVAEITLKESKLGKTAKVFVNPYGLIEIVEQ